MYRIYRKIPDSFQGDLDFSVKKWYILEELLPILRLISWSLPDDEGGITCLVIIEGLDGGSWYSLITKKFAIYSLSLKFWLIH